MAYLSLQLTDGINSLDLNPLDETNFRLFLSNFTFGQAVDNVEVHTSDDGQTTRLLRFKSGDAGGFFQVEIKGATRTAALNNLTELERWISGPNSQAARSEFYDRARPVYVRVKYSDVTNATLWRVRYGRVLTDTAAFTAFSHSGGNIWSAGIQLTLYPAGEAENPIYVNNVFTGSGDFSEYAQSGTNYIGYGWNLGGSGSPTATLSANVGRVGRYSQKVTGDSANDYLEMDLCTVPFRHIPIGIVSFHLPTANDTVTLTLRNASTARVTVSGITNANASGKTGYVDTIADENGNDMHLFKLVGTVQDDQQLKVRIGLDGAADVCYVDFGSIQTVDAANIFPDPEFDGGEDGDPVQGIVIIGDTPASTVSNAYYIDLANFTASFSMLFIFVIPGLGEGLKTVVYAQDRIGETFTAKGMFKDMGGGIGAGWGTAEVTFGMYDGAGNELDSITFDDASLSSVASGSATGADTDTWYSLELTGTNSLAPGVYLAWTVTATGIDPEFAVDSLYLYADADVVFQNVVQINGVNIANRSDHSGSNENRRPSLALYNVPGSMPAFMQMDVRYHHSFGATGARMQIARFIEERFKAPLLFYEIEQSAGWWTDEGTDWADQTDVAMSGGKYTRHTGDGAISAALSFNINADDILRFSSTPMMLFVRARTSEVASCVLRLDQVSDDGVVTSTIRDDITLTTDDTWEWIELGPLVSRYNPDADNYVSAQFDRFFIYATADTSETVDLDVAAFMPVADGDYVIANFPRTVSGQDNFRLDGRRREIYRTTEGKAVVYAGSGLWELQPGHVTNRLYFQFFATDGEHVLADTAKVKVKIIPRTQSMLGTI